MAARKKAASKTTRGAARKKKATAKKGATKKRARSALDRLEDELPANLRDYAKQIHKQLNTLEKDIERAIPKARRRTARLIREASHKLGELEANGQKAWKARADSMTKDAQKLLRRLEKAVSPPRKTAKRKKTKTPKKAAAKKRASKAVSAPPRASAQVVAVRPAGRTTENPDIPPTLSVTEARPAGRRA